MTILLLKGYNNYFNRIVKSEVDVSAYKSASDSYLEYTTVNFDPNDGIATSLVVGGPNQKKTETIEGQTVTSILDFEDAGSPDYLVAHENNVIKSRWFINECVRVRGGQYKLALKRDVLVDFNEQIMNSPCFVEKGSIVDVNDPLLLNAEGMAFNQQKQSEQLLRDNTNCAWLVGYLKKDISQAETITYTFPSDVINTTDLDDFAWANCVTFRNLDGTVTNALKTATLYNEDNSTVKFRVSYKQRNLITYDLRENFTISGNLLSTYSNGASSEWEGLESVALYMDHHGAGRNYLSYNEMSRVGRELFDHTFHWDYVKDKFDLMISSTKSSVNTGNNLVVADEDLTKYDGLIVTHNSKVYKLTIGQGIEKSYDTYYTGNDIVATDYLSMLYYAPEFNSGPNWTVQRNQANPDNKRVKITLKYRLYSITATEVILGETITYTLPVSSQRNNCNDALYDMFCMPVSPRAFGLDVADTDVVIVGEDSNQDPEYIFLDINSEYQLAMASQLATKLGAGSQQGYIYDLQLLPYCPMDLKPAWNRQIYGPTYDKNVIDVTSLTSKDYVIIRNGSNKPCGVVFYPQKANFSTSMDVVVENTTVHYEWLTVEKPTLLSQGRKDGLTRWTLHEGFPYPVTDGVWDIGPNSNNPNVNVELSDGLTNDDCDYINLSVSGSLAGGNRPFLSITSDELPLQPADDYSTKITGDFTVKVLAHWILPNDSVDKKIENECDFYRLTSPNYNSFYEFKKTKLYDGISGLRAICTYKPFTPYIKINPNLDDSLYSIKDYNDNIGLMLSGDFSIPMLSDAMVNYELANRNYQAIFNRGIQNLDVNQRIAKEQQQFQGIVGAITGGIGGAAGGAMAGAKAGPYGAIAGAVVGAVGGTTAGIVGYEKDKEWLREQQYEARDFAIDKFNYQLGNIQALPQTLTKSTPLSFNNKVWPILELFSCTDKEKEVLRNKIKYDGMTIMAVGTLVDYAVSGGYLKGKMIRLLDLNDDSHVAQAIYEEVNKGFYEGE